MNRILPGLLCVLLSAMLHAEPAPLRVMLLSGAGNHNWRETTPELCKILQETGRFQVDVIEDVPSVSADSFANYDVILSNYNTFNDRKPADAVWKAEVRAAFLAHIRAGHGFVVVHAGSSVFYDWPEFQQLAATSWTLGKTSHGERHAALVTFGKADHAITRGLEPFWTFDEFWENAVVQPGAETLALVTPDPQFKGSGKAESIMFATHFGEGRGFTLLLGHNVTSMKNTAFRTLLQRGTEWAATGRVTLAPATPWPESKDAVMPAEAPATPRN
ncbi:MAG: ThuA domain-containing protein [Opitutaceae bacterium]|jgi:type 1 glutamine amidotransferase